MTEAASPRRTGRRALLIGLGAVIAFVIAAVIAAVITVSTLNAQRTPESTAQEYFEAIAAGDAATATRLDRKDPETSSSYRFLTDEVLGAATERISDIHVQADGDDDTLVRVSFMLAGEVHHGQVRLVPGEPEWGVLRTWQIDRAFARHGNLIVFADVTAEVAGVPLNPDGRSGWTMMYPGVYPLSFGDSRWFEPADPQLVMSPDDFPSEIQVVATDALREEAEAQARDLLDACAESVTTAWPDDDSCPLHTVIDSGVDPRGSWEIVSAPRIAVADAGRNVFVEGGTTRFTSVDGTVVTTPIAAWVIRVKTTDDTVTLVR